MNRHTRSKIASLSLIAALVAGGLGAARGRADDEKPAGGNGAKTKVDLTPFANDKKFIALHADYVKKAEKLAAEYEQAKQPGKAAVMYEQILRLAPEYEFAQQQLDRLRQRELSSTRRTFEVQANKDWQDTGIRAVAGQPLKLTASGEWTFNMSHKLGPDGMEIIKAMKDFKLGSLIGIIADPEAKTPKPFYIGAGKEFVPDQSGPLLVRMHDSDPSDNKGSIVLEIMGRYEAK